MGKDGSGWESIPLRVFAVYPKSHGGNIPSGSNFRKDLRQCSSSRFSFAFSFFVVPSAQ
jgi:hypothetical protein